MQRKSRSGQKILLVGIVPVEATVFCASCHAIKKETRTQQEDRGQVLGTSHKAVHITFWTRSIGRFAGRTPCSERGREKRAGGGNRAIATWSDGGRRNRLCRWPASCSMRWLFLTNLHREGEIGGYSLMILFCGELRSFHEVARSREDTATGAARPRD
jgi:hypothetical protein